MGLRILRASMLVLAGAAAVIAALNLVSGNNAAGVGNIVSFFVFVGMFWLLEERS